MNKTPTFSVIIPTFNRALTIGRAIDSVLGQTFTDWELIIVDDGSTDETKLIVSQYKDSRIIYFWQENQERSAARNQGVEIASSSWICFLDSDDAFMPHHLFSFYNGMLDFPGYDMYRTGFVIMDQEEVVKQSNVKPSSEFHNTYPNDYIFIYAFNRQVFKYEKFDERFIYIEDMHFLLRITSRFSYLQLPYHTYRYYYAPHINGRLSRNFKIILYNLNICIDDMLLFEDNPIRKFLQWTKIVNVMLYLLGCIKFDKMEIINGLYLNLKTFIKNPILYTRIVLRIIYVKVSELFFNSVFHFRF